MKFADIPKYTSVGNYQVNIPLEFLVEKIEEEEKNLGLQLNPDFQRGHVWTEEQQIKYMEFILRGGQSSRVIYFNHPNWMGSFKGDFVLVDGLQRLTACMKFMKNEISAFGCFHEDFEDKRLIGLKVDLIFNVNNLKTRKEVLQWYLDLNEGGVVHTKDELGKVKKLLEQEK
jgi:uncharacterized protein with ParB-like and HNH nuclease domain